MIHGGSIARAALAIALLLGATSCGEGSDEPGPASESQSTPSEPGTEEPGPGVSDTSFPLTVTDFVGHEETFEAPPERVAILSGTSVNIYYDAGGEAVGITDITGNARVIEEYADEIRQVPELGPPYTINSEALAALDPDLVISMGPPQEALVAQLQDMGIATLTIMLDNLDDVATAYRIFGAINETSEHAEQRVEEIAAQYDEVLDAWPGDESSVVILHVTAQSLTVKLDNSIAGQIASDLGLSNIASGLTPTNPGAETAPLDVEEIVRQQPDHVLVTSMISSNEQARESFTAELERNSAWQAVDAVREDRVIFLPQQYFLYNAGPYYADSVEYLAASLHPEIYGEPVEPA